VDNPVDSVRPVPYCPASAPNPPGDRGSRGARGNPAANRTSNGRPGIGSGVTYDDAGSGARTARRHDRQEGCLDRPRDPLPTRVDSLPDLPPAFGAALEPGLGALGLTLSTETRAAIEGHVRLLLAWNAAINLTGIRDVADVAVRHVLDSLTALPLLAEHGVRRLVDLGSGGGFPGLPLAAAAGLDRVRLVESIAKKARFLETVVAAVGLADRVEVLALRAEALAVDRARTARWDAVTARAVAPLAELVELAFPLLAPGGCLIAWKSASALEGRDAEVAAARRAIGAIDPVARIEIAAAVPEPARASLAALADHRLVIVTRSERAITGRWPRDPASRRRAPW